MYCSALENKLFQSKTLERNASSGSLNEFESDEELQRSKNLEQSTINLGMTSTSMARSKTSDYDPKSMKMHELTQKAALVRSENNT